MKIALEKPSFVDGFDEQGRTLAFGLMEGLKPPLERADEHHDDETDEGGKAHCQRRS
ncbi:hypothetical protein [Pararhizobium sp. LjRoot238]|uniref:hypothetical protein n=1 Tax=Pararhizobium sp. LjRoot238 TaxID=3342293 RepID=UPI003ECC9614